jgi:hypothetical protein
MTSEAHTSINRTARLAGALYLAVMPFAFFGIMYVPSALVVPGDPATTSGNILASEFLFRSGTVSHLIGQIIFIFQVLALYRLLKPVNRNHAALMVILVLLSIPVVFLNEVNHLAALRVLSSADDGAFTAAQLHAQAMLFLDMREYGMVVAHVFWGLWLLPLGFLVFRSGFLPRLLGVVLMVGGACHVIDAGTQLLVPGVPTIAQITFAFAMLAALGELLFALWLLIRGVNVARWQEVALSASHGAA